MSELWVPTYTGKRIDLLNPNPNDINIQDIAHSLALCNRYLGTSVRPYSVAEHSVRLAYAAEHLLGGFPLSVNYGREGLMHDAHEAYTWDLPRMIVGYLGSTYQLLRVRVDAVIRLRFGLADDMSPRLRDLDKAICRVEVRSGLFTRPEVYFHCDPMGVSTDAQLIEQSLYTFDSGQRWYNTRPGWGWDWRYAERRFLEAAAAYGIE